LIQSFSGWFLVDGWINRCFNHSGWINRGWINGPNISDVMPPHCLYLDLPKHFVRNMRKFCWGANSLIRILHLARCKCPVWQVSPCCCSKGGACSFSLPRPSWQWLQDGFVLSKKEALVPFLPSLPVLFLGAPLYFTCLAYSDSLWPPFSTAQQTLPLYLRHYGLFIWKWRRVTYQSA